MKTINVKNTDRKMLCDDEDFEFLNGIKWQFYQRYPVGGFAGKRVLAHRLLMDPKGKQVVDHINGDRFDNRRENLRVCTNSQNLWNRRKKSNTGVRKVSSGWAVDFLHGGARFRASGISTREEAVNIRNDILQKLRGEFHNDQS